MPQDEDEATPAQPAEAPPAPAEGAKEPADDKHPKPRPEGEPEAVVELRGLVEGKLSEMLEGYAIDGRGSYVFNFESAHVFVVPAWLPDERTVLRVFAVTNLDVPVTARLTSYLLAKNLDFVLGSFALDADKGAVWFNHNLLGQYLDPDELEATVVAVAQTANELDDEIKDRFGGRLFAEQPSDSISPPVTPGYL